MTLTQQDMELVKTTAKLTVEEAVEKFRGVAKETADAAVKLHAAECKTKQQFWQDRNRVAGMAIVLGLLGGAAVSGVSMFLKYLK